MSATVIVFYTLFDCTIINEIWTSLNISVSIGLSFTTRMWNVFYTLTSNA